MSIPSKRIPSESELTAQSSGARAVHLVWVGKPVHFISKLAFVGVHIDNKALCRGVEYRNVD